MINPYTKTRGDKLYPTQHTREDIESGECYRTCTDADRCGGRCVATLLIGKE